MYKGILNHKEDFIDTAVDSVVVWLQDSNKEDLTITPTDQEWLLGSEYAVMLGRINAMKSIAEDYPFLKELCDLNEVDEKKYMDHEKSLYYLLTNSIADFMLVAQNDSKLKSDIRYLVFNLAIHLCRWRLLVRSRSEPEKLVFANEPKVDIEYNIGQTVEIINEFLKKTEETEYDPILLKEPLPVKVMASSSLVLWGADNFEKMLNEEYERRLEGFRTSRLAYAKKEQLVKCLINAEKEYINYKVSKAAGMNTDIHALINSRDFREDALRWYFFYKLYGETGREIEAKYPQYKDVLPETTGIGIYSMFDHGSYVEEEKLFNIFGTMISGEVDKYQDIADVFEFNIYISVYLILCNHYISGEHYEASENAKEKLKSINDDEYPESILTMIAIGLYFKNFEDFSSLLSKEEIALEEEANNFIEERKSRFRNMGLCQYCGGAFKGLLRKVCSSCGSPLDY